MLGSFFGKVLAAPARTVALVPKLLDVATGERPEENVFDKIADVAEEQTKKVFDGGSNE